VDRKLIRRLIGVCALVSSGGGTLAAGPVLVPLEPGALEAPSAAPDNRPPIGTDGKLHAQLRAALDALARGSSPQLATHLPAALHRGDRVLVEVRFSADQDPDAAHDLLSRHGGVVHNDLGAALHEAWMPLLRLRELADEPEVVSVSPARLVRPLSKTSEGVAAGNANYWQSFNPAYTGTGITIAMVDQYDNSRIAGLQSSDDWPPNTRLSCFDLENIATNPPYSAVSCTSGGFGAQGVRHGDATMEIAYDVAPGAKYRAYDTATVGDWYNAILDAANVNALGTAQGAIRANVISASLAAPLDGIGDGTALHGSIAEAAGYARNRGILVVNAAGNERENHWGGLYAPSSGSSGIHTWNGSNTILDPFGDGVGSVYCIPAGETISLEMYWNNWVKSGNNFVSNHDYGLYLYENISATSTANWVSVAFSDNPQTGGVGQVPQEMLLYTTATGITTNGCPTNNAVYALQVTRNAGTTANDNLQLFATASAGETLYYRVNARSLDFPSDSPNVLSVAAIDVANMTTNPQEPFSSEGPVLASGGALPSAPNPATDTNLKPDVASFDHVTTATLGTSAFYGTSAAAPHAAGMGTLFMQRFGVQASAANLTSKIVAPLQAIANTGSNDLGTAGKDYQYGYGRLRFQKDASLGFIQQPGNTLVNTAIAPAIKVGIYDSEGKPNLYTLFDATTLAIASDPHGGSAVLSGGGSGSLTLGVATYSAAKINLGGNGYTLGASVSAAATPPVNISVTSNPFNITTGAATKLVFTVPPSAVVAGHVMSPAVQVSVEDSNGNVVNSASNYMVTLKTVACSGAVPTGGGPVTTNAAVAMFSGLVLDKAGSGVQLQATASGLSPTTSSSFTVTANSDWIFRAGFETCSP
jgi:Subtilase family